jgi:hypothetical protein
MLSAGESYLLLKKQPLACYQSLIETECMLWNIKKVRDMTVMKRLLGKEGKSRGEKRVMGGNNAKIHWQGVAQGNTLKTVEKWGGGEMEKRENRGVINVQYMHTLKTLL